MPQQQAEHHAVLAASGLGVDYDGRRVLRDVTFEATPSRITVLIGPSGAGKSTCIRHLVGLALPSEGRVLLNGRDTRELTDDELRFEQRSMSVMLQGSVLYGAGQDRSLSVFENVAYPLRLRTRLSNEDVALRVGRRLEQFGLTDVADVPLTELSAGTMQRVSLARTLVSDSDIVVIDSPESGIDGVRMNRVVGGIRAAQRETGATFLIATHDVGLTLALADTLAVIRAGRLVAFGPAAGIADDHQGFTARFMRGEAHDGLAMEDAAEGPFEDLPAVVAEPSDRLVSAVVAFTALALLAILLVIVIGLLVFRGPNVPPGV